MKTLQKLCLGAAVFAAQVSPAVAQERTVDIGDIKTVAGLMLQAGYKAEIKPGKNGTSYIASGANGNEFTMTFYNCKKKDSDCESLEFFSWYKKKPYFSNDLTNEWNATKRFLKVAIDEDGDLVEYLYVSAIGQTTFKNFADYIDWFTSMDGSLGKFLDTKKTAYDAAHPADKDGTDKAPAKTDGK